MSVLDLDRFAAAPLAREPYDFVVLTDFIKKAAQPAIAADFPDIAQGGSFPLSVLDYGPAFANLVDELQGPAMRRTFAGKFGIDLEARPVTITARGHTREKDGQIHADSKTKLITVLIYMNPEWSAGDSAGQLRLLRSPESLDDAAVEIPPAMGTLVAFRCAANAWHGHHPFVGARRAIQLNWVTDKGVVRREEFRHRLSALAKRLTSWRRAGR
ncbi:MAG: 2OG-Fe(II) oxygenase [Proteobacteria bacterium]|nr:2OG-Fe(II) oxygenase [Pseudomonadota bacterium]MBI3498055.1 2OG-Fe(II) oxygenase [Pseudomonadota bacterium]